jgi:hypothetical protein
MLLMNNDFKVSMRLSAAACLVLSLLSSCNRANQNLMSPVVPAIPLSYYSCVEAKADDLLNAYFIDTRNNEVIWGAEESYNGKVFVFKNILLTATEMKNKTLAYIWIKGRLKCYGINSETVFRLKAGNRVDIVGVNGGLITEYSGSLLFTGCVFLPAGYCQLPAEPTSGINPGTIY